MLTDVRTALCSAVDVDDFFEVLRQLLEASDHDAKAASEIIVDLHNANQLDAVAAFRALGQHSQGGHTFFELRQVFENALPHLQAEPEAVMACVAQLIVDAGGDLTANTILNGFQSYCAAQSSRPSAALAEILRHPQEHCALLVATLVAGSEHAPDDFLAHAIRLCTHDDLCLRAQAVFALGRIAPQERIEASAAIRSVLDALSEKESDDHVLACIIAATVSLHIGSGINEADAIKILHRAASHGQGRCFVAASNALAYQGDMLAASVRDTLLEGLTRIEQPPATALPTLDVALERIVGGDFEAVCRFLEKWLLAHKGKRRMRLLPAVRTELRSDARRLGTLVTKWLASRSKELRAGAHDIVCVDTDEHLPLEVDPHSLLSSEDASLLYIARKVVGYLFEHPLTCASLLVSLMRLCRTAEAVTDLSGLLLDPVLLNSSESVRSFLVERAGVESDARVANAINSALRDIAKYLGGLQAVGRVADLGPPSSKREAYQRHFDAVMNSAYRLAQAESVIMRMARITLLLYGEKSVTHIRDSSEGTRRMELPLQRFTTSVECPRMQIIDPVGMELTLRMFRNEELSHENGT